MLERGDGRTVDGQDVQMVLWLAAQELNKNNGEQQKQIDALKSENQELKQRILALEAK